VGPRVRSLVRDVFVLTKPPFLFRNGLLATDAPENDRPADPDEVRRLSDAPVLIRLRAGEATVNVAASGEDQELLSGPYRRPVGTAGSA